MPRSPTATFAITDMTAGRAIDCLLDYEDPYVQPLIVEAFQKRLAAGSFKLINSLDEHRVGPMVQFSAYEALDFDKAIEMPNILINAYVIRKALIRKHYLSTTVSHWIVKHPESKLRNHVKSSVEFELDYAEFLDDALVEAWELQEAFRKNEDKEPKDREWWILKPGMSDRGQGIKLFSTEQELQDIFEAWEAERPDSDDEEEEEEERQGDGPNGEATERADARSDQGSETGEEAAATGDSGWNFDPSAIQVTEEKKEYIITSQLRHFIAQPYIHPPLTFDNRKFHIRTYVLAVGALRVYVYKPMLALFAAAPYGAPWEKTDSEEEGGQPDLRAHLTNTCLQGSDQREGSVRAFWDLPDNLDASSTAAHKELAGLPGGWKEHVFSQICSVTGELFEAAARAMMIHFQPLPQAFELFGVDYMVDTQGNAWLLEINAFPDFRQTGDDLKGIVKGLFEETVDVAVKTFFQLEGAKPEGTETLKQVLDIDLGRR
ncbi:Tubulin-tyrosine ligase [Lasiodiplodia theobromae]|uniref:Putative tubulin--tyrosine ligase n=1 Tax=Lasiodiplodia theobromae TaxID=45133 RepID=A0A5N5DDS5_9PEZI|nr:Tubulin-tyrosine ligase [Lasiodiplodia theobromae]KAB2575909.1 putative tubulin--tyrosine ligase [Lasiodiplodia theobromae]KAF4545094.1 Tubulin-tyrosine ligase [Lasiodiplodia theobromae]KAF9631749.1 Tubulin-tyrosine ligase [Lasiodiplodia theobromae]